MPRPTAFAYKAHEHLVGPARPRAELWRLIVGLAVVAVLVTLLNVGLFAVITFAGVSGPAFLAGETPASLLVLLASFGFVTLGVSVAARCLQKRSLRSIIGTLPLAIRQFHRVFAALLLLGAVVVILPPYSVGATLIPHLAFWTWLALLPFAVGTVLIQVSAEEILFHGYIQQSLAARFRSPWIWMGIPSLIFAAGHYAPGTTGENAGLVAIWSGIFGLFAADLTARSGTLGPAIALHLFNNIVALIFISLPDNLSGLALFLLPYDMSDGGAVRQWLFVDFAMMVIGWLAARVALRR